MLRKSSNMTTAIDKTFEPEDSLWGQRAGDLHEGVYNETGEFLGSFVDYWQGIPPAKPQRTGWWAKRILK